jgi:hypothetical protein
LDACLAIFFATIVRSLEIMRLRSNALAVIGPIVPIPQPCYVSYSGLQALALLWGGDAKVRYYFIKVLNENT